MAKDNSAQVAQLFDVIRDQRDAAIAERDALRSEVATYRKTLDEVSEIGTKAVDENDALRTTLREVKGLLPLVFESSATYDKIMALLDK